jgi:hypothetical protein
MPVQHQIQDNQNRDGFEEGLTDKGEKPDEVATRKRVLSNMAMHALLKCIGMP